MARALSVSEILKMKKSTFEFTGKWFEAFGTPERVGVWFIWGNSGNGKTSFVMQLIKMLAGFEKTIINSLEEGASLTTQDNYRRFHMEEVSRRLLLLPGEPMEELSARLEKPKSPKIIVIDSFQYTQMSYKDYIRFKEKHRDKLIIFISHADGKYPAGRAAKSVMYDATMKIWVEGYRAFSKGRFIGPVGNFTIYDKGAARYWGE